MLFRSTRRHPTPLAGEWLDAKKTTAADTSVWLLAPDGGDYTLHVLVQPGDGPSSTVTRRTRHGLWFLRGPLADTAARALCFNSRPGRNPTYCTAFALDTLPGGTRRLVLRGYHGTHEVATRTLVERRR